MGRLGGGLACCCCGLNRAVCQASVKPNNAASGSNEKHFVHRVEKARVWRQSSKPLLKTSLASGQEMGGASANANARLKRTEPFFFLSVKINHVEMFVQHGTMTGKLIVHGSVRRRRRQAEETSK